AGLHLFHFRHAPIIQRLSFRSRVGRNQFTGSTSRVPMHTERVEGAFVACARILASNVLRCATKLLRLFLRRGVALRAFRGSVSTVSEHVFAVAIFADDGHCCFSVLSSNT